MIYLRNRARAQELLNDAVPKTIEELSFVAAHEFKKQFLQHYSNKTLGDITHQAFRGWFDKAKRYQNFSVRDTAIATRIAYDEFIRRVAVWHYNQEIKQGAFDLFSDIIL